jgi:hypothetical protein
LAHLLSVFSSHSLFGLSYYVVVVVIAALAVVERKMVKNLLNVNYFGHQLFLLLHFFLSLLRVLLDLLERETLSIPMKQLDVLLLLPSVML